MAFNMGFSNPGPRWNPYAYFMFAAAHIGYLVAAAPVFGGCNVAMAAVD